MMYSLFISLATILTGLSNGENRVASSDNLHPFHLSKCHIKYQPLDSTLQTTMILFLDDFEEALSKESDFILNICDKSEIPEAEALIEAFLFKKFKISIEGIEIPGTYIGKECETNNTTVWCYIEFKLNKAPNKIKVYNSLLMETFPDQKNIVDVEFSKGNVVERMLSAFTMSATFQDK